MDRGFLKPIPHGDIVLFSVTLACLFRWFQTTQDHLNFLFKLLRYNLALFHAFNILINLQMSQLCSRALVGDGELRPSSNILTEKKTGKSIWNRRHILCPHSDGCIQNCFQVIFFCIHCQPIYSMENMNMKNTNVNNGCDSSFSYLDSSQAISMWLGSSCLCVIGFIFSTSSEETIKLVGIVERGEACTLWSVSCVIGYDISSECFSLYGSC